MWVEIRLCDADAFRLCHRDEFSTSNIRTTPQHFCRDTHCHLRWRRGDRLRSLQQALDRASRLTEQSRERVLRLSETDLELRNRCPRALEQLPRLRYVQFRCSA